MKIPRNIFQTISRREQLLPEIKKNINYLKDTNKNWEYKLFFDEDRRQFIEKYYEKEFIRLYDSINPEYGNCRADLFRYLLMYICGGVYLDIKSTCTVPMDEILEEGDEYLLSHWRNDLDLYRNWGAHLKFGVPNEFQQWHIICAPRHPFLLAVINRVKNNINKYNPFFDGVGRIGALKATGPIPYSQAILPIKGAHSFRNIDALAVGIEFSIYENTGEHYKLSKKHYSKLDSPIVKNSTAVEFLWKVARRLKILTRRGAEQ